MNREKFFDFNSANGNIALIYLTLTCGIGDLLGIVSVFFCCCLCCPYVCVLLRQIKRQAFPRFYFLADDGLLELLSRCHDTTAVQPHLRKCFDAIHSIDFGDGVGSNTINAMASQPWRIIIQQLLCSQLRIPKKRHCIPRETKRYYLYVNSWVHRSRIRSSLPKHIFYQFAVNVEKVC